MAGYTAFGSEQLLTFSLGALSRSRRLGGWLGRQRLHVSHPSLKILGLLRYDAVRHPAMLNSAELPALSRVITLGLRGEPHPRLPIGKDVPFRGKLRNPKTVDHVVTAHAKRNHPTHRNVQLIRRGQIVLGIAELPPPLVPYHFDGECILSRNCAGLEDGTHRRNGYCGQNERGDYCPDNLDDGVAVCLVWLGVSGLPAKAEYGVEKNALHQYEDEEGPPNCGVQQIVGDLGEVTPGKQGALGVVLRAAAAEHQSQQEERGDPPEVAPAIGPEEHHAFILL